MDSHQRRVRDRKLANSILCMVTAPTSTKLRALRLVQRGYCLAYNGSIVHVYDTGATTLAADDTNGV